MHRKMIIYFSLLYVFFASWTDSFKVGGWLPLYQFFAIAAFFLAIVDKNFKIIFNKEDIFLFLLFFALATSSMFNIHDKTLNYLFAYLYVFIFLYIVFKSILINYNFDLKLILNVNTIAVIVVCLYSNAEFFLEFLFSLDISQYVFRTKEATAIYMIGISRSYGFATEPTTLATYLNTLGPIALWNMYSWKISKNFKKLFTVIFILGWFFTFSAAGFLFLILGFLVSIILLNKVHILFSAKMILLWITLAGVVIVNYELIFTVLEFMDKIINKITLASEGTSSSQRTQVLTLAIDRFLENPIIGLGLGYTSSIGEMSPINWYLVVATNGGIFALVFLLIFLYAKFKKIFSLPKDGRLFFMVSYFALIFNFNTISTFYNPFFWIFFAILELYRQQNKLLRGK